MDILHLVLLALIQGVTEFLPVSSSGHLVLFPAVTGYRDQGLLLDVAVHVGTLGAVLWYLRRDIGRILVDFWRQTTGLLSPGTASGGAPGLSAEALRPGVKLGLLVVAASFPVILAGLVLHKLVPGGLRSPWLVAGTTLGFGLLLWISDRIGGQDRVLSELTFSQAVIIGLAQILALVPGTSRSGITMTAARHLGYGRSEAARFSMLLAVPAILGAGTLAGLDLMEAGDVALTLDILLAAGLAFLSALVAIQGMMAWLRRASFTPFVLYRIALGIALVAWLIVTGA